MRLGVRVPCSSPEEELAEQVYHAVADEITGYVLQDAFLVRGLLGYLPQELGLLGGHLLAQVFLLEVLVYLGVEWHVQSRNRGLYLVFFAGGGGGEGLRSSSLLSCLGFVRAMVLRDGEGDGGLAHEVAAALLTCRCADAVDAHACGDGDAGGRCGRAEREGEVL